MQLLCSINKNILKIAELNFNTSQKKRNSNTNEYFDVKFGIDVTNSTTNLWKKKNSVSNVPGGLNLKFTFQFDYVYIRILNGPHQLIN